MWKSVSADDISNYQDFLWQLFADISFSVHLAHCPSSCDSHEHREQLEGYLSNIVCLMHSAAYHCLPLKDQCQSKMSDINGWNQYVRPYQVAARQSFGQWAASGKPTSGPVYERLKRYTEEIRLDRIAGHMLGGSNSQFWKTVDKLKSSKLSQATSINRLSNEIDIAQLWRSYFPEMYDMSGTSQNRQSQCLYREVPFESEFVVEADMVEKVIQSLMGNKAPGSDNICEEHLMYAPGCVIAHISTLFTCMLIHGYMPNSMTDGIIGI